MRFVGIVVGSWMTAIGVFGVGCSTDDSNDTGKLTGAGGSIFGSGGVGLPASGAASIAAGGLSGVSGMSGVSGAPNVGTGGASLGSGGAGMAGTSGGTSVAAGGQLPGGDGGLSGAAGEAPTGAGGADSGAPTGPVPIDDPVPDDCITDVSPGDHSFTCQGISYLVMVAEQCTEYACGVILDLHGAAMSGQIMRTNNRLHQLAPEKGYLTVHPTAPTGAWDLVGDPPRVEDFIGRMVRAFHADERRIHMTGFSMGSAMTFWFLCNRPDLLASAGPVTGASADQVRVEGTSDSCIEAIDADWQPRVPILFMSGREDNAFSITAARARTDGIVTRLGLMGGEEVDGDSTYSRKRWEGADGMVFDFLEHGYSSGVLAGHCIPGGPASDIIFACSGGNVDWGETVLEWFIEHPKL